MYVYLGSLAGDLAGLGMGSQPDSNAAMWIKIFGFVATVIVTIYVTKVAKRALKGKVAT